MIEPLAWSTRYYSPTAEPIDSEKTLQFRDDLTRALMGCCPDNSQYVQQFTSDGVYQTSYDGGTSFVDTPNLDPRNRITYPPPLASTAGSSRKCEAANCIAGYFKTTFDAVKKAKDTEAAYSDVAAIFAGVVILLGFITLGWFWLLCGAAIAVIYANYTATEWSDSYADPFLQTLIDDVYCNIENDGTITPSGLQSLLVDLEADLPVGGAKDYVLTFVRNAQVQGVNSAMRQTASKLNYTCSLCSGCALQFVGYPDAVGAYVYGEDSDGQFIEGDSVYAAPYGGHVALFITDDDDTCCKFQHDISEGATNWLWNDCGTPRFDLGTHGFGHQGLAPSGDVEVNTLGCNNATAFHFKFYFVD